MYVCLLNPVLWHEEISLFLLVWFLFSFEKFEKKLFSELFKSSWCIMGWLIQCAIKYIIRVLSATTWCQQDLFQIELESTWCVLTWKTFPWHGNFLFLRYCLGTATLYLTYNDFLLRFLCHVHETPGSLTTSLLDMLTWY